jgi:ribose transport system permease protein
MGRGRGGGICDLMSRKRRTYVRPVEVAVPYGLLVVALIASWYAVPRFLSTDHLTSMSITAAYLGIIAIGQTLVLLLGGIDLSIPYAVNMAAIILVQLQYSGHSTSIDFALVMLFGLGVGLANGVGVALLDISPLVMTLGMNSILQGAALIYSKGNPLGALPEFVTTLSTGLTGGWPNVVLLWIVLGILVTLVLVFTRFGRNIYSIGANRPASELCGLSVKSTIVAAYAVSGLCAALAGVLLAGYTGQAYLGMGDSYLLPSIAVVVIGGTSIYGGRGSYVQTVAGVLMITVITSALVTVGVTEAERNMLYGGIILLMAYVNQVAVSEEVLESKSLSKWLTAFRGWLEPVRRY